MRNGSYEQRSVEQIVARIPGAGAVLRSYGIDRTSQLTLAQAAAAASVDVDEVVAVLEAKVRRLVQAHYSSAIGEFDTEESRAHT